jgi:hypothetical protein
MGGNGVETGVRNRASALCGFHPGSQVCRNDCIVSFVVRDLHRKGVQLLTWNMQPMAIQPQEDKCCGKARSLVSIAEPLGTGESYQVASGQVRKVGVLIIGPPVDRARKRGAHDILVNNPVRPAIPLDLLGMDHQEHGLSEPVRLFHAGCVAHFASSRNTPSYSAMIASWASTATSSCSE